MFPCNNVTRTKKSKRRFLSQDAGLYASKIDGPHSERLPESQISGSDKEMAKVSKVKKETVVKEHCFILEHH